MQTLEGSFDVCTEELFNQTIKLEEMEKKSGNAEAEVSAHRSRLILLQENTEKQMDNLEKQLKDAVFMHGESERKYEDISRKLA